MDDVILYIENPKDYTKTLLELISKLSKVAGYKNLSYLYSLPTNYQREKLRKQSWRTFRMVED